jgi:hypothetical protein
MMYQTSRIVSHLVLKPYLVSMMYHTSCIVSPLVLKPLVLSRMYHTSCSNLLIALGASKTLGVPVESDPSPNVTDYFQAPQLVVDNNLAQEVLEEFHIFGDVNVSSFKCACTFELCTHQLSKELWDYEEAYVYNPECERNQFLM